jgi:ribosomal protein S18 acetylase RimI-like enzyme
MQIINSTIVDIEEIFRLYKIASDYQKEKKTVVVWPDFDKKMVEKEIAENRQWKLVVNNVIICVWAITFSDEQIWEKRNQDAAIYIHRIATNPEFRGQNFIKIIVDWAREYALENKKEYIRLDTLGNNTKLIEHYCNSGFNFLGMFELKHTNELPLHYQKEPNCCLFEIKIESK